MTKFVCIKSSSSSEHAPKVGDVIEGELIHKQREHGINPRIIVSNVGDRMAANGRPYWSIGESVPLNGSVWTWKEVK